jgi:hypothetical protein
MALGIFEKIIQDSPTFLMAFIQNNMEEGRLLAV